jgi:hypothetical protein
MLSLPIARLIDPAIQSTTREPTSDKHLRHRALFVGSADSLRPGAFPFCSNVDRAEKGSSQSLHLLTKEVFTAV